MKNLRILLLGAMFLIVTLLAACGSASDENNNASNTDDSDEEIEIRLLTRMSPGNAHGDIFYEILDEFEEEHPNVKIVDESMGDESAFNNKFRTDLSSGTVANIFRVEGVANLGEYIDSDIIMDLEPELDADEEWGSGFNEGFLDYYRVPGYEGIYGIPMETGLMGVYYNEELFAEAGIEEFPETWTELLDAIEKLTEIDVVPITLGAKAIYMAGHVHNQVFYKWLGAEAAKELGTRQKKWTDDDVVETLQFVKDLDELGAFGNAPAGVDEEVAITNFLEGDAAMFITGPFNHARFNNPDDTDYTDSIKLAKFPYFEEKPEFKDDDMQIVAPYMVNGQLEGAEKEYTLKLLKKLTDADAAKRFAEEAELFIPRTDIEYDEDEISDLFEQSIELGETSSSISVDVFDFDPITSMQDVTRNAIVGMLTGGTAEEAAEQIQREVDRNE